MQNMVDGTAGGNQRLAEYKTAVEARNPVSLAIELTTAQVGMIVQKLQSM